MSSSATINQSAPIALYIEYYPGNPENQYNPDGRISIMPLTPCCQASATGSMGVTACRSCYEEIPDLAGDCWEPDSLFGWDGYKQLMGDYFDISRDEVEAHVAEGKRQAEEFASKYATKS